MFKLAAQYAGNLPERANLLLQNNQEENNEEEVQDVQEESEDN